MNGKFTATHGRSRTREYEAWHSMRRRCSPTYKDRKNYFDRGIKVSPLWEGKGGFALFFAHIGPRPSDKHSLDRIDNDKGYEPGNVRWATFLQQSANKRGILESFSSEELRAELKRRETLLN